MVTNSGELSEMKSGELLVARLAIKMVSMLAVRLVLKSGTLSDLRLE